MTNQVIISVETIEQSIFLIRGHKVMLDSDLARLYVVSVGRLNEAVKRNLKRFPTDFMFQLDQEEFECLKSHLSGPNLKSQFAISSLQWGGRRHAPYAFTEQGIAMLSSVLHSDRAIEVNIEIMRAFVRLRQILASHKELAQKMDELEKRYDSQFRNVFDAIQRLMTPPEPQRRKIGFNADDAGR